MGRRREILRVDPHSRAGIRFFEEPPTDPYPPQGFDSVPSESAYEHRLSIRVVIPNPLDDVSPHFNQRSLSRMKVVRRSLLIPTCRSSGSPSVNEAPTLFSSGDFGFRPLPDK